MQRPHRRIQVAGFGFVLLAFLPVLIDWARHCAAAAQHGYALVIPLLAVIVLYRRRHEWPATEARGGAAWLLSLSALGLLVGSISGTTTIALIGFPLAVIALLVHFFGWSNVGRHVAVVALFFLMIPVPTPVVERASPILAKLTGEGASRLLDLGHEPATFTMPLLHWGSHVYRISDACSGLSTWMTLLVTTSFIAGLADLRGRTTLLLLVLNFPLALATNVFRVAASAVLIENHGLRFATPTWHEALGLVPAVAAIVLLTFAAIRYGARQTRVAS